MIADEKIFFVTRIPRSDDHLMNKYDKLFGRKLRALT